MADILPEQPSPAHQDIAQTAARHLGALADGNGITADQVRVAKQDITVHKLHAAVVVDVIPEISHRLLKGRQPRGQVLGNQTAVTSEAKITAEKFLEVETVRREAEAVLDNKVARGFGVPLFKFKISQAPKEYSVIDRCNACQGNGTVSCQACQRTGRLGCTRCHGAGSLSRDDGSHTTCPQCNGQRTVTCHICQGQGQGPCVECDRSGYTTHVYQAQWVAQASFVLDRTGTNPHVLQALDEIGIPAFAADGHADIFRLAPEMRLHKLAYPYVAHVGVAQVEFSINNKTWPAVVAGLKGHVLEIEPFLDTLIKPGLQALQKLSKGPMASAALMERACRYKLIRTVIGDLSHHSRKWAYQKIIKNHPHILSDKYAKASIKYASEALMALSIGPRRKGLVIGTIVAALPLACWFMMQGRSAVSTLLQQKGLSQHVIGADIVVYLAAYALCVLTLKMFTAAALKKILPENLQTKDRGLPPAGETALWALLTVLAVFAATAFFSSQPPEWVLTLTKS